MLALLGAHPILHVSRIRVNYINVCSSYRHLQIQVFQPVYTLHITHEKTVAVTIRVHFTPVADTTRVTSQEIS